MSVPAGGSLVISVASAASSGSLALYVSQGALPTPYDYQEESDFADQPDPAVTVAQVLTPATYNILVESVAGRRGGWVYNRCHAEQHCDRLGVCARDRR